ncbi:universal stress protein [Streptomyces sp. NBC_01285]|nr:universal stress protein [Streptomyces sp. NBC_01285]MCX4768694.1 universal stress protein [Streptomyces sp. NBC_01285]
MQCAVPPPQGGGTRDHVCTRRCVVLRPVTVGLNGTPESLAAAGWGAHEAMVRNRPLLLVSAWEWQPYSHAPLASTEMPEQRSRRLPEEAANHLAHRYPGLGIATKQLTGPPPEMLCQAAAEAEMLVLGTTGLGALTGFLMGSVAMATVAHTHRPVVLVRPGSSAATFPAEDGAAREMPVSEKDDVRDGPVLAAIDLGPTTDGVLQFAFEAAAAHSGDVQVIYSWNPPVGYVQGIGGDLRWRADIAAEGAGVVHALLGPWREKYPEVSITERPEVGSPGRHLVGAAASSSLVVIGRRTNRYWPRKPRIGHVAHAVLHHSPAPVAVIPQDSPRLAADETGFDETGPKAE